MTGELLLPDLVLNVPAAMDLAHWRVAVCAFADMLHPALQPFPGLQGVEGVERALDIPVDDRRVLD